MAEIRKFDPAAGNAIAQALRQAMGDPVRPVTPGAPANSPAPVAPEEPVQTAWLSLRVGEPDQNTSDPTA
ncbi:MAG: hypothetical protein KIT69_05010 [Propionibacteriaceae bacterium]|nr:hypothetical protein [Propionibacteriaceae bacterium]